ncbi:hypothetical protein [Mycolicibacterium vanbaalenii]|uniref:hypothetical protein n=1 Tax=Mycolicibacterium vanbaalenii TaxID=110539 RepID=UPI0013018DAF|nr:hypothetical protein [Mycolicibacterium vanbaalenii]MCV7127075.1 hypothetical protein [Mycolicibacterium vanbaalenii PYR-1]
MFLVGGGQGLDDDQRGLGCLPVHRDVCRVGPGLRTDYAGAALGDQGKRAVQQPAAHLLRSLLLRSRTGSGHQDDPGTEVSVK